MAEQVYEDSNYRFSDPIRFFKANDPYYFEVDNIPLKQLQENCLWLKDQVRKKTISISGVKREDLDELRPYATGADRKIRVKPGRYSARINDASTRRPLAYLRKIMGEAVGDVDAFSAALPNPGNFPDNRNQILTDALETFKTAVAEDAMGMNGFYERAFTWAVVNPDTPIDGDGFDTLWPETTFRYEPSLNNPGGKSYQSPMVITQSLVWAKSLNDEIDAVTLPTYEITDDNNGFAKLPRLENHFIKAWRGVSRLAVVDVDEELSVDVLPFGPVNFAYIDEDQQAQEVDGTVSRIDLVYIWSKPVDMSGVQIIDIDGPRKITKPELGIIRGAGVRQRYEGYENVNTKLLNTFNNTQGQNRILGHPGDQKNTDMGFTSTSANDLAYDVRGSFPSPDDLMNLAPLISQELEDNAYELIGQSILPVAYVFVQAGSEVVLSTDVVDIRPLFRTAELTYNERAGIGAAFPQLSLANPAVGKAQMDYELRRVYQDLKSDVELSLDTGFDALNILAAGYIFGGFNFGPEGALYNHYAQVFANDNNNNNDSKAYIRQYVASKYGLGSNNTNFSIPAYPDWDLSQWCVQQDLTDKGLFPNDYINTYFGLPGDPDASIVAGSSREKVNADGTDPDGDVPDRLRNWTNTEVTDQPIRVNFHYISKKIKFNRPSWLADYSINVDLVNCLPQNQPGINSDDSMPASYVGHWVEKGFDEFTVYVAFTAPTNANKGGVQTPRFPAPHSLTYTTSGKKKKTTNTITVSQRDGDRFSSFVVPVSDILYKNTDPISELNGQGYIGNPRIAKCTYPTVMWSFVGVPQSQSSFMYGNLNSPNPTINLKGGDSNPS